ncbi:hypothetical protein DCC79_07950 [bacterium]|nr:MAG: hypothetical protein DCC79_07950 [bacterium]
MIDDERTLISRAARGDTAAFEALVARHAPFVHNLALRTLGDPRDAEDVAQEAFLRAWRGLPAFRTDARFSTWLYRIVVNLCYSRLPALRAGLDAIDIDARVDLPDLQPPVEAGALTDELRAHLYAAIDGLPPTYRLLIAMRHGQDMSYQDIADSMDLPLGTVKTGIHRARRQLQGALEAYEAAARGAREAGCAAGRSVGVGALRAGPFDPGAMESARA